jgi:hypothetical protein
MFPVPMALHDHRSKANVKAGTATAQRLGLYRAEAVVCFRLGPYICWQTGCFTWQPFLAVRPASRRIPLHPAAALFGNCSTCELNSGLRAHQDYSTVMGSEALCQFMVGNPR